MVMKSSSLPSSSLGHFTFCLNSRSLLLSIFLTLVVEDCLVFVFFSATDPAVAVASGNVLQYQVRITQHLLLLSTSTTSSVFLFRRKLVPTLLLPIQILKK